MPYLGEKAGRSLCVLYAVWLILLLAVVLRYSGERLLSSAYAGVRLEFFLVPLLVLSAWMAHLRLAAFARMAEIGYLALAAALVVVLLLSLENASFKNLLPVVPEDAGKLPLASLATLDVAACGVYVCFLAGALHEMPEKRQAHRWLLRVFVFLILLQVVSFGVFGAPLVSRMQAPLFLAAREVSILGIFDRLESVVVSLWILTDLISLTVLLRCARCVLQRAVGIKKAGEAIVPLAFLALPCAYLIASDAFGLSVLTWRLLRWLNLGFAVALPTLSLFLHQMRRRDKKTVI